MSGPLRSKKVLLALGGAVLIGIVAGGWFLLVSPKREKAVELEASIASAKAELEKKQAELAQPRANVRIRVSDLFRLAKALPDAPDMPGILLDVNRLANANELEFRSILPSPPVAGTGFAAHPLTVVVQGRFSAVSSFLADLRKIVRVRNKSLDARGRLYSIAEVDLGQPSAGEDFPKVSASIVLDAFSFVPAPPPAPAATTSTTATSSDGTVAAAGANP
jgi:Tfp pilus assembly protein PilO